MNTIFLEIPGMYSELDPIPMDPGIKYESWKETFGEDSLLCGIQPRI